MTLATTFLTIPPLISPLSHSEQPEFPFKLHPAVHLCEVSPGMESLPQPPVSIQPSDAQSTSWKTPGLLQQLSNVRTLFFFIFLKTLLT